MQVLKPLSQWINPIIRGKSLNVVIWTLFGVLTASWLACHPKFLLSWLTVPYFSHPFYLFLPALLSWVSLQIILRLSPQQQKWSRILVVSLLLAVTIRYLVWRIFCSLNLSDPLNGVFSIGLMLIEILALSSSLIQLGLMLNFKERKPQARGAYLGEYQPTVDILIPTYNEPAFILRRTIVGCQALQYSAKKIYLLDDTQRLEIERLAQELGCFYITRPDNRYAKAGNLNHAVKMTQGELIAVFDADFIPTSNFLQETLGFFQNPQIALVQTPQSFYNADPITRNLGLENYLPPEEEVFYRQIEPMKDSAKAVVCSGTSFVLRRKALEEVGYFVTESVSEDYYTGIRLSALGYEVIYLNKKLSAGLAAESINAHISQRLRWARGTLQSLFISSSPFTISGLKLGQRIAHLEGLLTWLSIPSRVIFLLLPVACAVLKINPINISISQSIYFFLPYYWLQISAWNWLNFRSRSVIFSELSTLISCVPLSRGIVKILLSPFQEGFQVTPKGLARNYYSYNWKIATPLMFILTLTLLSLVYGFSQLTSSSQGINLGLVWGTYNALMIGAALIALLDAPKAEPYEWFERKDMVKLSHATTNLFGYLDTISETGACLYLGEVPNFSNANLEILGNGFILNAQVSYFQEINQQFKVHLRFVCLPTGQHRQLIEFLYCQPGQWVGKNAPGELASLWLLLNSLRRSLQRLILYKPPSISKGSSCP